MVKFRKSQSIPNQSKLFPPIENQPDLIMRPTARILTRPLLVSRSSLLRTFSTTPAPCVGRRSGTDGPSFNRDDFENITGELAKDGLSRYDEDFLETSAWVKDILVKMRDVDKEVA
ncbi:hypothetical protein HK097_002091, partial [Rhizophlyctis rosea]